MLCIHYSPKNVVSNARDTFLYSDCNNILKTVKVNSKVVMTGAYAGGLPRCLEAPPPPPHRPHVYVLVGVAVCARACAICMCRSR